MNVNPGAFFPLDIPGDIITLTGSSSVSFSVRGSRKRNYFEYSSKFYNLKC